MHWTCVNSCARIVGAVAIVILLVTSSSHACVETNVGGTAILPPDAAGCDYVAPTGDLIQILPPALPAGTTIDIVPSLVTPFNEVEAPGGSLGGHTQTYDAILLMQMTGTGALAAFNRNIGMQVAVTTESAPRNPGDPVQNFAVEMINMDGQLFGDPDFDTLSIQAGVNQGLAPAPGITQLTRLGGPGTDFNVDSFFDIEYRIDFQGAPGSILEQLSGPTVGTVRLQVGNPIPEPSVAMLGLIGTILLSSIPQRKKSEHSSF